MSDPPSWYSHVTPPPNKKKWFFYSHLSHHSQKKQNKERTKKSPARHVWSTIILCNFQSCCCCYFCFGRCIVWGKISNYWLITFWMKNIFYVKSGWSCSVKWGFPGIFFWQKQKWTKLVGYHFLDEKHFLREIRLILLYEMGFSRNFFLTKTKMNQTGWLSLFGWKTFFTWNQVDPALWNGAFPDFSSWKNKTEPKWLVIMVWDEPKF